ncbi:GDSL-type esterase/lipase family protein [Cupriavidus pauculus]|uniref:SGNH hydrolase-type esterase domain-containing protein n=1 Tax=Cupriavidus pauculus TaxID=82633 RepID=A0A2N5CF76_9BURK|nr:GDSL-type esterase/lipase family protein [Cupriavidus pauculus]PLQ00847.1 hypothetical protein CYJ10_10480 [Cupriavidus pauculus]
MPIFRYAGDLRPLDRGPDILAIGDSWHWYPENNLLNVVDQYCPGTFTYCVGANGAEAVQLSGGRYLQDVQSALEYASIRVVLISAGGNDFAGMDDFAAILKSDCSNCKSPEECFAIDEPRDLFNDVMKAYETLITTILAKRPDAIVLLHAYDYAVPDGRTFHGLSGQWLKVPMDNCRVPFPGLWTPDSFRRKLVKQLIDELAKRHQQLAATFGNQVRFIDTRGVLADDEWANELHPTREGFTRLGKMHFAPAVNTALT